EPSDVRRRLHVVDREAAANVERVEGAELRAARRRDEAGTSLDGLHVFDGIGSLRADVERQSAHIDPELRRDARKRERILRIAAEFAREVAYGAGTPEG